MAGNSGARVPLRCLKNERHLADGAQNTVTWDSIVCNEQRKSNPRHSAGRASRRSKGSILIRLLLQTASGALMLLIALEHAVRTPAMGTVRKRLRCAKRSLGQYRHVIRVRGWGAG